MQHSIEKRPGHFIVHMATKKAPHKCCVRHQCHSVIKGPMLEPSRTRVIMPKLKALWKSQGKIIPISKVLCKRPRVLALSCRSRRYYLSTIAYSCHHVEAEGAILEPSRTRVIITVRGLRKGNCYFSSFRGSLSLVSATHVTLTQAIALVLDHPINQIGSDSLQP